MAKVAQPTMHCNDLGEDPIRDIGKVAAIPESNRNTIILNLPTFFAEVVHFGIVYRSGQQTVKASKPSVLKTTWKVMDSCFTYHVCITLMHPLIKNLIPPFYQVQFWTGLWWMHWIQLLFWILWTLLPTYKVHYKTLQVESYQPTTVLVSPVTNK